MKKTILALAALSSFAGAAHAQSSVTLYGSIDAGLRFQNNTTPTGGYKIGMSSNGNYNSNRFGFRGVEDLGNGYNAHFNLEAGFNSGTGALNNTNNILFQRTAYVGLGGWFGSVDLGHMFNVAHDTIGRFDPFDLKYLQIALPTLATDGSSGRDDNTIRYNGRFSGLTTRAEVSLGGMPGSLGEASTQAIGFTYDGGPYSVSSSYTHKSKTTAATLVAPFFNDNNITAGGAYKIGPATVMVGFVHEDAAAAANTRITNRWLWGGVRYRLDAALEFTAAYYDQKNVTAGVLGHDGLAMVGATYSLSRRTNFYAEVDNAHYTGGYLKNATLNPSLRPNSFGASVGINHVF